MSKNQNDEIVATLADVARKAARTLVKASYEERKKALLAIADALEENKNRIIEANLSDMEKGRSAG